MVSFYSFPYNAEGKDNLVIIYTSLSPCGSQVGRTEENAHSEAEFCMKIISLPQVLICKLGITVLFSDLLSLFKA